MTASMVCSVLAVLSMFAGFCVEVWRDVRDIAVHGDVHRRCGGYFLAGQCAFLVFVLLGGVLS